MRQADITSKTISGNLICCFPLTGCTSLITKMMRDENYRGLARNWKSDNIAECALKNPTKKQNKTNPPNSLRNKY